MYIYIHIYICIHIYIYIYITRNKIAYKVCCKHAAQSIFLLPRPLGRGGRNVGCKVKDMPNGISVLASRPVLRDDKVSTKVAIAST